MLQMKQDPCLTIPQQNQNDNNKPRLMTQAYLGTDKPLGIRLSKFKNLQSHNTATTPPLGRIMEEKASKPERFSASMLLLDHFFFEW